MTLAFIAGLCHASAGAINTSLAKELGMKAVFLQAFGSLFTFSVFHAVRSVAWARGKDSTPYWI